MPKNIRLENLDTIQEKIYRIFNLTIFEYNIFEKISAPKIWIRYFQKVSGPKIWIQSKKKFIVFLIWRFLNTIFLKKYQPRKFGYNIFKKYQARKFWYNTKIVVSYTLGLIQGSSDTVINIKRRPQLTGWCFLSLYKFLFQGAVENLSPPLPVHHYWNFQIVSEILLRCQNLTYLIIINLIILNFYKGRGFGWGNCGSCRWAQWYW